MPLVSVIVPNYNHAPYLGRRLDSVLGQTFGDVEVLLLDDASTDGSRAVLESRASDPRVRLLFNDRNSGSPFCQWNRGVAASGGAYVWVAESDDWADERFLERLVPRLEASPAVAFAQCRSQVVDERGRPTGLYAGHIDRAAAGRWEADFTADGRREVAAYLCRDNVVPNASAVVFRRSAFEAVGGADERLRLCGDWLTWARMARTGDVAYAAEPLNYYRAHAANVRSTTRKAAMLAERYHVLGRIRAEGEVDPAPAEAALDETLRFWVGGLWGRLTAAQHWAVYRAAVRVDPRLHRRLLAKAPRLARRLLAPATGDSPPPPASGKVSRRGDAARTGGGSVPP